MMTAGLDSNICGKTKTQSKRLSKESITKVKHYRGESVLKTTQNKITFKSFSSNISESDQDGKVLEGEGIERRTRAGRTLRNRKYR